MFVLLLYLHHSLYAKYLKKIGPLQTFRTSHLMWLQQCGVRVRAVAQSPGARVRAPKPSAKTLPVVSTGLTLYCTLNNFSNWSTNIRWNSCHMIQLIIQTCVGFEAYFVISLYLCTFRWINVMHQRVLKSIFDVTYDFKSHKHWFNFSISLLGPDNYFSFSKYGS